MEQENRREGLPDVGAGAYKQTAAAIYSDRCNENSFTAVEKKRKAVLFVENHLCSCIIISELIE